MAKMRIINTRFWIDDYISNLDPVEKLLFLYFLTSPQTDICGVYEVPLKVIATETGIDKNMVEKIIKRFTKDGKIFYKDGWVAVANFKKHQSLNPKVERGIEIGLSKAPKELVKLLKNGDPLDLEIEIDPNKPIRKKIKVTTRKAVIERDGRICQFCGKTNEEALLEIDHIIPVIHGGSNELENLRVLCQQCNGARNAGLSMGGLSHPNPNSNSNSNSKIATAEPVAEKKSKYTTKGADVLKAFESVDSKNKTYYANKTQREACDFLIAEHGLERVLEAISVLPEINQMKLYIAQITTPYELKQNWVKLGNAIKRKQLETNDRLSKVVW